MEKIALTSPVTGVEFEGLKMKNGNVLVHHPLLDSEFYLRYDVLNDTYVVPAMFFQRIETMSMSETAKYLDVSRQRILQIAKDGVIRPHTVHGSTVFLKCDVIRYDKTRKVGAPKKGE